MDVNIINGNGYSPAPMPGSGEFSPAPPPEPVQQPAPQERRPEIDDALQRAVSEVNSSLAIHGRHLSIRHHEPTNRRIVTVYDSITNEVVREIPPERVLDAHASMLEMVGLFVNTRG